MTDLPANLEDRIIPEPNSGCWIWLGNLGGKNYGVVWDMELNRRKRAHRAVYEILVGHIPSDKCLCHHCDNTYCVNPDHMFIGTKADNNADMRRKKRQVVGEKTINAKLTEGQILQIRQASGSQTKIADQFGITQPQVSRIKAMQRWKHVGG